MLIAAAISLPGCGGGGGDSAVSNNSPVLPTTGNVQPLTINAGPIVNSKNVNSLYTSITICAPGSATNCQTINHILVDTGSTGLRIMASALPLQLPAQTDNVTNSLVECFQFATGTTWGPIKLADVKIAGEKANSVPIQVIDDSGFAAVPATCSNQGDPLNSVAAFGANGVLGIGVWKEDYGNIAAPSTVHGPFEGTYYICPATGCKPIAVNFEKQVQNPVSKFATNKNGVIISLPSIPQEGARNVTGSLIFGIGTQDNNRLGDAKIIPVNSFGYFVTTFNGLPKSSSFIDSGSNGLFFPSSGIPVCLSNRDFNFYCPLSNLKLSVTIHGSVDSVVDFTVANAYSLFANNPTFTAFTSLAGENPITDSFDFGLSFFYGRNVYTAIEGKDTGGGNFGPYVAY